VVQHGDDATALKKGPPITLVREEIMCAGCSDFDTSSGERGEIALSRSAGEGRGEGGASPE
jgi:hypothetical protein